MARNGERRKTNVEESKEDLSPSLPNPAPSPFFLTHFSLLFPNYLKACYRLNTCIPSFSTFYGIYSTWASSTFGALLLISRNGLVVLTFQLELLLAGVTVFFLSFFYFFFVSFYRIFLDVFFASLPSLTHSPPSPANPSMLQTRGNDHSFCFRPFVRLFSVLGLHKKYGLFYGLKVFALIAVLVSWKLLL